MLPAGSQAGPPVVAGTADFDGRGSNHTAEGGGGGRLAPEPQGPPCGVRAVPNPFPSDFPEDSLRDGDLDRQDIGSPVDMLVNTVARMQKDIATLREENRLLRTPAIPQVVQAPQRVAFTTTITTIEGQRQRQGPPPRKRPARRDWTDVVYFSFGKSGHAATRCPNFHFRFISVYAARMADGEDTGRGYHDTAAGDNGPPAGGKWRLIREGGGGGALGTVVMFGPETQEGEQYRLFPYDRRHLMTFFSLWNSRGGGGAGGPQLVPSGVSTVWTEETLAGDTPGRECPHDDVEV